MGSVAIPDKVIVIGGLPRSGKTILTGVLGSHSQVAVPESGLNFFHYFGDEDFRSRGGFEENLDYFFESCRKSKTWRLTRDMFTESGSDQRDLYLAMLQAFRTAHVPDKKYVGEYTHMSEEHFDRFVGWFGLERLRFLQIIRDPYDNYASWVVSRKIDRSRRKSRLHGSAVHLFCNAWSQSTAMGLARTIRYPKSYRTLFFDQIKEDPRGCVKSLCEWLGIPAEVEPMLNMVDQHARHNTVFQIQSALGSGVGYVRQDSYDRRAHLTDYELDVIKAMSCPNLLSTIGYEKQRFTIDWKHPIPIQVGHYSSRLKLMARSYLSPLSTRQAAMVYMNWILEGPRILMSRAIEKLVPSSLRRNGAGN